MVIVLVTAGKHESVDSARIVIFESANVAKMFCEINNTGRIKYWTKAEIVSAGKEIELCNPEE